MNRTKKKNIFILLLLFVLIVVPAGQVYAANEETYDEIETEVASFLENVYTISDEGLESVRGSSGFYEILVRSWYEDREITGDFVEVQSVEAEDAGNGQIIANSVVEFENYLSDVVIYLNKDKESTTPVNYVMNIRYSMAEKMTQAGQNMAVGLIVVFVVLIFLMFIISLFRFLTPKKKESTVEKTKQDPAVVPVAEQASIRDNIPENTDAANSEEEIAAVIAAAIAAASEEAPSPSGYVVRSVRRRGRSVWKRV